MSGGDKWGLFPIQKWGFYPIDFGGDLDFNASRLRPLRRKGNSMSAIKILTEIVCSPQYSAKYINAKAFGTCIKCGRPAKVFRDAPSTLEYRVSALCQTCQDELFSDH
jgi:hypothetical protein